MIRRKWPEFSLEHEALDPLEQFGPDIERTVARYESIVEGARKERDLRPRYLAGIENTLWGPQSYITHMAVTRFLANEGLVDAYYLLGASGTEALGGVQVRFVEHGEHNDYEKWHIDLRREVPRKTGYQEMFTIQSSVPGSDPGRESYFWTHKFSFMYKLIK